MVRHHHPSDETVAFAVEMQQRVLDDAGDALVAQQAFAVAGVEVVCDAALEFGLPFAFGQMCEFISPVRDHLGGHRVSESESDPLHQPRPVEMRQVVA